MRAVLKPDGEFLLRRMYRWYSKTFSTPLHEVEDLPVADILTAYYEETYDAMEPEHRELLRQRLAESDEQRAAREATEVEDANDDDAFMRMVEEEEMARLAKEVNGPAPAKKSPSGGMASRETDLPDVVEAPPDIKMTFSKDRDFQDAIDRWDQRG